MRRWRAQGSPLLRHRGLVLGTQCCVPTLLTLQLPTSLFSQVAGNRSFLLGTAGAPGPAPQQLYLTAQQKYLEPLLGT